MKLSIGFVAALVGCAAAAQPSAEVFMFTETPNYLMPKGSHRFSSSLARLLFLQRLTPSGSGPLTEDALGDNSANSAVGILSRYGMTSTLFSGNDDAAPRQLMIMMEGMTPEQIQEVGQSLKTQPGFKIENPPSTRGNDNLIKKDLYSIAASNKRQCTVEAVANPLDDKCWTGKSLVAKYNVQKDPSSLDDLHTKLSQLSSLARQREMETILVLIPHTADNSGSNYWSDKSQELRRRQGHPAEQVVSAHDRPVYPAQSSSSKPNNNIIASEGPIPACFNSEDSCATTTGNCSGHGSCQNKYANADGSDGKVVCYTCHCLSTASDSGSITHWAGPMCTKKDVSVPFWLFAGFTIIMVAIVSMSIGLLYSIGEEKLPGVIGAGVSRSK